MTLAELVADVATRHKPTQYVTPDDFVGTACVIDPGEDWPCDAARLAALLTPESVARGLPAAVNFNFLPPRVVKDPIWQEVAVALLAAITEADR